MMRVLKSIGISFIMGTLTLVSAAAESRVALKGHVPRQLRNTTKLERVPADESVQLSLIVHIDENLLKQTLDGLYGPNAPAHKKFLTSAEFAQKFGLADKREKLKTFAQANGLTVNAEKNRGDSMVVELAGNADHVEKAFGVELHHYRDAHGHIFRAHETEPTVPSSLAPQLSAVLGLSTMRGVAHPYLVPHPIQSGLTRRASAGASAPSVLSGTAPGGSLAPSDIKTIYGLNQLTVNGTGQSVAVLELDTGYNPADISAYETQFALPNPTLTFVGVDGNLNLCGGVSCVTTSPTNSMIEVALDMEMVVALAPHVSQILVYDGPNSWQGILDTYNQIALDNTAKVVSTSWGTAEQNSPVLQAESQIFQRMAAQGQTIYAASGDSGADDNGSSLSVEDPASQPYVTAAGGTSLSGSIQSPVETTWSGSGGGVSVEWALPNYQAGVIGAASQQFRNVPDVALNADPNSGYGVYVGGSWWQVGGTSAAAPLWAAMTALINQQRLASGKGYFGFANPNLYQVGANNAVQGAFHDITSGNNGFYNAGPGYDNTTGWGSYIGSAFINSGSQQFPTIVISTPTAGQALTGIVSISGTANAAAFASYKVEYASSISSATFHLIGSVHTSSVTNNVLETWNTTALSAGVYSLKVTVTDTSSQSYSSTVSPLYIDRSSPTVVIVSPLPNAAEVGVVTASATATDDSRIAHVDFLVDQSIAEGTAVSAPYLVTFNTAGLSIGAHTLTAKAFDVVGKSTSTSIPFVVIADTIPPSIPINVTMLAETPTEVYMYWSPSPDNVGTLGYQVDVSTSAQFTSFIQGGQNLNIVNTASTYLYGLSPKVTYYARVRAYDGALNISSNSSVAQVTMPAPPPPVLSITYPLAGATVFGRQEVDVYTYSQNSIIQRVAYSVDASSPISISTYPYTFYWDTTLIANGSHQLTATTYDMTGASVSMTIPTVVTNLSLFQDNFNSGHFSSWTVVDDGNLSAPSSWQVVNGSLTQTSAIHGSDTLLRLGTQAITGGPSWTDYSLNLHMTPTNGDIGVIFRRQDKDNYYRFSMSSDGFMYLAEILGGTVGFLNNYQMPYVPGQQYTVTIDVKSYMLRVFVNGQVVLQANNASFAAGGIGLYTYNTTKASFDDVQVVSGSLPDTIPPTPPTALKVVGASQNSLTLNWSPATDNVGVYSYLLDVSTNSAFSVFVPGYSNVDIGNATQKIIPGLAPSTAYYMRLRAYDAALNVSSNSVPTSGITLQADNTPPNVTILSPANGATVSGMTSVSGTAMDNVGVASVSVSVDANFVGYAIGTSTWTFALDTRLFSSGSHTVLVTALDAAGNSGGMFISVKVSNPGQAEYNYLLFAPVCSSTGPVCDSGPLENGRDGLVTGPEPHQPNTIHNSCADGTAGAYHADESNDRLKISTLDGSAFTAGKPVKVEATVWAYATGLTDSLDLYYTASASTPTWNYLTTINPTVVGSQVLSTTYTLPSGSLQAIRANFRYLGAAAPCTTGTYDDHDDLAFAVQTSSPSPNLSVTPSTLTFTATPSGGNPAPQNLLVKNTGPVDSLWKATSDVPWLGVIPSTGDALATIGSQLIASSVTVGSLHPGTYTGHLTFTDQSAAKQVVTVTFLIPSPNLAVSPSTMTFTGISGSTNPVFQILHLTNTGGADSHWQAASDASWLVIAPSNGSSPAINGSQLLSVSATAGSLTAGTYTGHLTFTDQSTTLIVTTVTFNVNSASGNSAFFVKLDTTTEGSWKGIYGADGEMINSDSSNPPSYAQVTFGGAGNYVWTNSTTDIRALQNAAGTSRIASQWYSVSTFTVDINVIDGQSHPIALYPLDWSAHARVQRMEVLDAATQVVLDSRTISNFTQGEYLVWMVKGHVIFRVTNLTPSANGTISGIFFGGALPSIPPVITSSASAAGIVGSTFTYTVTATNHPTSFNATGLPAGLSINTVSGVISGVPASIGTSTVTLTASNAAGSGHALLLLTIKPASGNNAFFVKLDTTTEGSWKGVYGADGEMINSDSSKPPAYATVGFNGAGSFVWTTSTTDIRALQNAAGTNRIASQWYSTGTYTIDITISDGQTHQVSLYALDWSNRARIQRMDVLDGTNQLVLDSRTLSNFTNGQYPVWTVKGHVIFRVVNLVPNINGTISGIFFGGASTGTPSGLAMPAPQFVPPSAVSRGTTLTVSYDPQLPVQSFSWTMAPASLIGNNAAGALAGVSPWTSQTAADGSTGSLLLNQPSLTEGVYTITVTAVLYDGRISPPATANVTLSAGVESVPVRVHPNPFRANRGDTNIIFDQMPAGSTVKIFTISARWVITLQASATSVTWNLTNDSGDRVASGLYLYLITDNQGNKTRGKLAIIR